MQRVCSLRGITATSNGWRKQRDESRQVTLFSEPAALRATIGLVKTSARCHFIKIAAKIESGAKYVLLSASFPSTRDLGMCNSLCQPGGAQWPL